MGLLTLANQFDDKTPKQKMIFVGVFLGILAIAFGAVFYLGTISGRGFAESKYLKEREETMKKVDAAERKAADFEASATKHETNERQLAAENEILKRQNDATAEILKANDARIAGDAKKFDELNKKRQAKFDEIDADNDFQNQVCGLCADAASSGFKLSADFCRLCKGK